MYSFALRTRRLFIGLSLLLACAWAQAQSLSSAQLTTLKACINAVPAWAALPNDSTSAVTIAAGLNAAASPAWVVWKPTEETGLIGRTVSYVAVEAMTTANLDKVRVFYVMNPERFEPVKADVRSFWANVLSGALGGAGQASRDAMDALYRRNATTGEKCLSTGTGSTASPATLGYEGQIGWPDVQAARSL
jgi:hypothetical protein